MAQQIQDGVHRYSRVYPYGPNELVTALVFRGCVTHLIEGDPAEGAPLATPERLAEIHDRVLDEILECQGSYVYEFEALDIAPLLMHIDQYLVLRDGAVPA